MHTHCNDNMSCGPRNHFCRADQFYPDASHFNHRSVHSQTQPNTYKSTHSISQVTISSRDSPRSTSTPPGSRTPRRRQQELSGSYMDDTKAGDQNMMVYLTPLQRKEKNIKQLKSVLREKEVRSAPTTRDFVADDCG